MTQQDQIETSLRQAWHEETARNSFERWIKLCEQEGRHLALENTALLIKIFGASWYFTRFIFANPRQAITIIDHDNRPVLDKNPILSSLELSLQQDDVEARINHLRVLKNGCMLQILAGYLQGFYTLEQFEYSLTLLAEATLEVLIRSLRMLPQHEQFPVSVLAMGRMAGYEMTFGSDLDLIFLYNERYQELYNNLGNTIRMLLRAIAQPASSGLLYEVDMRLRPHGNSGLLITSYKSFIEYHDAERDTWERQMMTRCRPVLKSGPDVDPVLVHVKQSIYRRYERGFVCQEILAMRARVQKELGSPKGKYEIKRGYGGIMDIDFISHYFQLVGGHEHAELRTCSTREALRTLGRLGVIDTRTTTDLLNHYDYLKKVEMCLRLFDMKSVDAFKTLDSDNRPLSRAIGHGDNVGRFLEEYETVTRSVRQYYLQLLT